MLLGVFWSSPVTTTGVAAAHAYDAPALALIRIDERCAVGAPQDQLSGVRERCALPPEMDRGTSTTPLRRNNATNTGNLPTLEIDGTKMPNIGRN